ncbi:MAG: HNH endonuclease [Mariprofundaceae bacterium]|nr:HNH endonuclease [Mariprofundaceae bacterium]
MMKSIILCRVGWMAKYDGSENIYRGNMQWSEEGAGELWNFKSGEDSIVRGFVMLTAKNKKGDLTGTINIDNIGALASDASSEGNTIIFYAPNPSNEKSYVVGWYENAKVYRTWVVDAGKKNIYRNKTEYSFEVNKWDTFLILENKRNIEVINAQYAQANEIKGSYPGQNCVFFGSNNIRYVNEIYDKIKFKKNTENVESPDNFDDPSEFFHTNEGKLRLKTHKKRERSVKLVKRFKDDLDSFDCIICGFNFEDVYGKIGKLFIEAHHIKPIKDMKENTEVTISDLIPVCSNCHRMLHRKASPENWELLKNII